jgi:hypothetical protein
MEREKKKPITEKSRSRSRSSSKSSSRSSSRSTSKSRTRSKSKSKSRSKSRSKSKSKIVIPKKETTDVRLEDILKKMEELPRSRVETKTVKTAASTKSVAIVSPEDFPEFDLSPYQREIDDFLSGDKDEVEVRLGYFQDMFFGKRRNTQFVPDIISGYSFASVRNKLTELSKDGVYDLETSYSVVSSISSTFFKHQIRKIDIVDDLNPEEKLSLFQKKIPRGKVDIPDWGIRISRASEENIDDEDLLKRFDEKWRFLHKRWIIAGKSGGEKLVGKVNPGENIDSLKRQTVMIRRERYRSSFFQNKNPWRIDMTRVAETKYRRDGTSFTNVRYEVEIERNLLLAKKASLENLQENVLKIMMMIQNVDEPSKLMSMVERKELVRIHNDMFSQYIMTDRWRSNNPLQLYKNYWNRPKNIKLDDMLDPRFDPAVTIKLDGVRRFVYFGTYGTYMFNAPHDIFKIGDDVPSLAGTYIDCEYMTDSGNQLYAFDLLLWKGKNKMHDPFSTRMKFLYQIENTKLNLWDAEYITKQYFGLEISKDEDIEDEMTKAIEIMMLEEQISTSKDKKKKLEYEEQLAVLKGITKDEEAIETVDFYANVKKALRVSRKQFKGRTDGLIFQPPGQYQNNYTYKWKPDKNLSIDFMLRRMSSKQVQKNLPDVDLDNSAVFWLMVVSDRRNRSKRPYQTFRGTRYQPFEGYIIIDIGEGTEDDEMTEKGLMDWGIYDGGIVECTYNHSKETFQIERPRFDRDKPNNENTAKDVWRDIHQPITEKTIKGETLSLARRYINRVKYQLLNSNFQAGNTIIDIGSGRGGDIRKWDEIGLSRVFAVDPNKKNIKELKRRIEDMKPKTDIVIIRAGAEETDKILKAVRKHGGIDKVDGITSFSSLMFFPESKEKYAGLISTLSLLTKGKFVGMIMDGYATKDLLEDRGKEDDKGMLRFKNKVFSIEQLSELDDKNIYGNAIRINIREETSMVKDQTEWLFYFVPFKMKLKKHGFKNIDDDTIDKGDDYLKLPATNKTFVSLVRTFVFTTNIKEEGTILQLKPPSVEKHGKLGNAYSETIYYSRVRNNSYLEAFLEATDEEYKDQPNDKELDKYVAKFRRRLAEKLTYKMFKRLYGGRLVKKLMEDGVTSREAYNAYKQRIADNSEELTEVDLLALISKIHKTNIYTLRYVKTVTVTPFTILNNEDCEEIYNSSNPSVVLVTSDLIMYYLVSIRRKDEGYISYFSSNSNFTAKISREMCPYTQSESQESSE